MATFQKYFSGKYTEKGEKIFSKNGVEFTSREYIAQLENKIGQALGLTKSGTIDDLNGVDFIDEFGKTYQLKILCTNRASVTFKTDFYFNKNDGLHTRNFYRFRDCLKSYCKQFNYLLIYFGTATIGDDFRVGRLAIITNSNNACYDFFASRLYRGYATNNIAQCAFNKTPCSEFLGHFYNGDEFEEMLANVKNHLLLCPDYNITEKERKKIYNKYLGVEYD